MAEKIFLLLLCGIMCIQQILAEESSDHLVRRKRVINLVTGGDVPLENGEAPFVVNIRTILNSQNIGVGAILSKYTVITVANNVAPFDISSIEILVGSSHYYFGAQHHVIRKTIRIGNHERRNNDGIALLTVVPGIVFDEKTAPIQLHQEPLFTGTSATIFGWGCNRKPPRGTNYRIKLRSITVPIMNHRDCVDSYRNHVVISNNDICTFDANKRCGHTDAGAPLVVDNQLAGLYLWRGKIQGNPDHIGPDVFVVLQSLEYGSWIRNNTIHNMVHMRGAQQ